MKASSTVIGFILILALILWRPWDKESEDPPDVHRTSGPPSSDETEIAPPQPGVPESQPTNDPTEGLTDTEIQQVLDAIDNLQFLIRDYQIALGGNPVGTNAEITASLLGDNLKQLKLELPRDAKLNDEQELCDPWGTPWFFHQLSGTKMEIRSAGKDRKLYTDDDFVR